MTATLRRRIMPPNLPVFRDLPHVCSMLKGMAMNGYQLTFYTTLRRPLHGTYVKEWLIGLARELGIPGATVFAGLEGYGHDRRLHAAHFFEVADEPIMVVMIMSAAHKDLLMARLAEAQADIFHVIQPVEMGERPAHRAWT
jgi:PII-like signaling protein